MNINKSTDKNKSIDSTSNKRVPIASADGTLSTRLNQKHVGKRKRVRITTIEHGTTNHLSIKNEILKSSDMSNRSETHNTDLPLPHKEKQHFEKEYVDHYNSNKGQKQSTISSSKLSNRKTPSRNHSNKPSGSTPPQTVRYPEVLPPETEIRLNKYLANAGICSRREADILIANGDIIINGKVVKELGHRVTPLDIVEYKGQKVESQSKIYVLLNKPKNCVTTSDDPECRLTVMDLVKNACPERIYPVGRLDRQTTGVLLITNDGALAAKLTHPSFMKKKIYHVWLDKPVSMEHMQSIADGIELDDGEIHADAISYVTEDDFSQVGIEIHSGRNRIVRRIFEHFGYRILKLDRVYFAGLTKKNLRRGQWRYLNEEEVNALRMGAFE